MNAFKDLLDNGSWFFAIGQISNKNYDWQPHLKYVRGQRNLTDCMTFRFRIGGRNINRFRIGERNAK